MRNFTDKYRIGLDIGISSIGWAVLVNDENDEPCRILARGVRAFDKAETSDGKSLKMERREKRSMRRQCRRRKLRKQMVRMLLEQEMGIDQDTLKSYFGQKGVKLACIYAIRAEALNRQLNQQEWARLLVFFMQRRGYRSTRLHESDKEDGLMLKGVNETHEQFTNSGYRTLGEMIWNERIKRTESGNVEYFVRNHAKDYSHTYKHEDLRSEICTLFRQQNELGNPYATDGILSAYLGFFDAQRSFDKGPGFTFKGYKDGDYVEVPSPYGAAVGHTIFEKLIGHCSVYPTEKRSVKSGSTYERFVLLQAVNHLKLFVDGKKTSLTSEQREFVIDKATGRERTTYGDIRKWLALNDDTTFVGVNYTVKKKTKKTKTSSNAIDFTAQTTERAESEDSTASEIEAKVKFCGQPFGSAIKKQFGTVSLTQEQLDDIGYAVTLFKTEEGLRTSLAEKGFSQDIIDTSLKLKQSSGIGHLSLRAMREMLPFLEKGEIYSDAYDKAFINNIDTPIRSRKLRFDDSVCEQLTNAVVIRAVSQTIKVINAIIDVYGSPQLICLEFSRELARNADERKEIENKQKENAAQNERIAEELKIIINGKTVSGHDIVKYKLWKEQKEVCAYSGKKIGIEQLFDEHEAFVEVDHIIPYSRCYDDSYANKVVVLKAENQNKGNRTPLEFMSKEKAERFEVWVGATIRDRRKKERLLCREFDETEWKTRNLVDTQYIARTVATILRDRLLYSPSKFNRKVLAVNGSITAYIRKRWKLVKDRSTDIHHAQDAVLIATCTDALLQKISKYEKFNREWYYSRSNQKYIHYMTGEVFDDYKSMRLAQKDQRVIFPEPWENFCEENKMWFDDNPNSEEWLQYRNINLFEYGESERIRPLFVSRMPTRKISGPGHKDTICSAREYKGKLCMVQSTPIEKLKLNKDGEIKDYYRPEDDKPLYEALKERLKKFASLSDAEKKELKGNPFEHGFTKPKSDGAAGPTVKKVKTYSNYSIAKTLPDTGGIAKNEKMPRIDIFSIKDKKSIKSYYFVPIYSSNFYDITFPNRAATGKKPYSEWREMTEKYLFEFSLYPNDLVRTQHSSGISILYKDGHKDKKKEVLCYYKNSNISTASISLAAQDNSYEIIGLGIKSLLKLEKMQVDVLGNVSLAPHETRNTNLLRGK